RIEKALRTSQSHDFRSAYLELFFHQYFAAQGAVIEWHPKLPDTSHRPEFLVHLNGDQFLFEARISELERTFKEQEDFCKLLKPELQPLVDGPFAVMFSTGQIAPPLASFAEIKDEIIDFFRSEMGRFEIEGKAASHVVKTIVLKGTRYSFEFNFDRQADINSSPIVNYLIGGVSGWVEKLYANIEEKARRYGVPDKPFVIGIWPTNGSDLIGEQGALYGRPSIVVKKDSQGDVISSQVSNTNDGLFFATEFGRLRYRNVSAVAFYDYLSKGKHHEHDVHIYHNPYATFPLNQSIFSEMCQYVLGSEEDGFRYMERIPREP
ncbi:MAG: hypothetical protein IIC85_14360, partial [Chloroflexi bacterium]|nr:hypothetical protein [Chloroflexota bacterium]